VARYLIDTWTFKKRKK